MPAANAVGSSIESSSSSPPSLLSMRSKTRILSFGVIASAPLQHASSIAPNSRKSSPFSPVSNCSNCALSFATCASTASASRSKTRRKSSSRSTPLTGASPPRALARPLLEPRPDALDDVAHVVGVDEVARRGALPRRRVVGVDALVRAPDERFDRVGLAHDDRAGAVVEALLRALEARRLGRRRAREHAPHHREERVAHVARVRLGALEPEQQAEELDARALARAKCSTPPTNSPSFFIAIFFTPNFCTK